MRIILISFFAVFTALGALHAQVAAPRLNSGAVFGIQNPAVLPFGGPSRVGVSGIKGEIKQISGGITTELATFDGGDAQFRFVGDNLGFHVEVLNLTLETLPAGSSGSGPIKDTLIGLAFQFGGFFSIGISQETSDFETSVSLEKTSLPLLGLTLRTWMEMLYFSVASGTETIEDLSGSIERPVSRFGVGVHTRMGVAHHLEAYVETRGSAINAGLGPDGDEEETLGATVEFVFGEGLLIGAEYTKTDKTDPLGIPISQNKSTLLNLGWSGTEGLAIVFGKNTQKEIDSTTGDEIVSDILFVSIAFLF